MNLKIAEVFLENGDIDLIFDGLTKREDFQLILNKFLEINGVRVVKESEDKFTKACLLSTNQFEFVLVYDSASFVWNYAYAVKRTDHELLKALSQIVGEII